MSTLVISQEPKFEFEFIDGLQAIRHSLTASILKKIITGFYTFNTDERDNLLGYIPVETGSNENTSESEDQTPESDKNAPDKKKLFCSSHAPLLPEVSFSSCLRNLLLNISG